MSGVPTYGYTFAEGRAAQLPALRELAARLPERLERWRPSWRRILLAGIGASHAALATPLHDLRASGIEAARTDCSDYPITTTGYDAVLALSQSGRSRETTDLVARFSAAGVATVALTNAEHSPLREAAGTTVSAGDYPDSRVSTVGFVVTFAALGMLTDVLTGGRVHGGWARVPEAVEKALAAEADRLADFAAGPLRHGTLDVVASAPQLTTAEAAALLFREGPLVPATAYGTRTYLHGPMDVASATTSHIVIGGGREAALAAQLLQKPTAVLAVTDESVPLPPGAVPLRIPAAFTPAQRALIEVCVLQDLVARVAESRDESVDKVAFAREDTKIGALAEL
ncbi:SIS domain-containing protein [Streptomyces sp. NPDC057654]|uniref:SIS domain-containing protein n=1 Tax=Streptomyces sp. NPDC057654 TaxID=3346196 RepID=UPI0036810343